MAGAAERSFELTCGLEQFPYTTIRSWPYVEFTKIIRSIIPQFNQLPPTKIPVLRLDRFYSDPSTLYHGYTLTLHLAEPTFVALSHEKNLGILEGPLQLKLHRLHLFGSSEAQGYEWRPVSPLPGLPVADPDSTLDPSMP
jgi:hypothetical protein